MKPSIIVKIPDKCYISPDSKRDFPFAFSFAATYGYIPSADLMKPEKAVNDTVEAIKYPQIIISNFKKLLSEDKIEKFIGTLKKTGGDDWSIYRNTAADIIIKFVGEDLEPDFYFSASTEKFISDTKKNEVVTLTITVKNFPNIEDHSYIISTKVDYTPWAKSLTFSKNPVLLGSKVEVSYLCEGDDIDKRLSHNGVIVDTARSPYTAIIDSPSLFSLEVFNNSGMNDLLQADIDVEPPQITTFSADSDFFAEGDSVKLSWSLKSASTFNIDNLDKEKDKVYDTYAVVYPKVNPGARATTYTLRANGYINRKPNSTSANVVLTKTAWKKSKDTVSGFFSGEVYGNTSYNSRIFTCRGKYYCYSHPVLYESADCISWRQFSLNEKAADSFICIGADYANDTLYAMGKEGKEGTRLYITKFDFSAASWTYASAYQSCSSDIGNFSLTASNKTYSQTLPAGIFNVRCGNDGKWNVGSSIIPAYSGTKAVSGDYCFFKDRNYAVMLCDDDCIYVFDCSKSMEDMLFKKYVGKNAQFVSFLQTINKLYIMTGNTIIDVKTQEAADDYYPKLDGKSGRPWLGVNKDGGLFGIFPDKNIWKFII